MRKLPPLNAVRAFEVAARHLSFTKAAAELCVTRGAVSRQVSLLEAWLGTPLFHRSLSRLTLTEAGSAYLGAVTSALDRISVASAQLLDQAAPSSLWVSAPPTFLMRWLIPRMSSFQRRHADVEIKLTTLIGPIDFQEQGYDIAIRGAHEGSQHWSAVPFMTESIVPVCHVDLLEGGGLRSPHDLADQTLISYGTELLPWKDWLQAAGVADVPPANMLQFDQLYFALQAAAEGLGVVLSPLYVVADEITQGHLCAPFGMLAALQRTFFANYMPRNGNAAIIKSFCEWLVREGRDTERSLAAWTDAKGWTL